MASNNNKQGGGMGAVHVPDQKDEEELDPKFEWLDNANNFLLRLTLTGFKKEDFRVQVDGTGKLTVRGQRPPAAGSKHNRFHKVFQLPSNANIDDITGRFEANVLTITVPKRPAPTAAPPTTVQEIKQQAHRPTAKQDADDEAAKKKKMEEEEAANKRKKMEEEEAANKRKKKLEEEEAANKKKKQEEDVARMKKLQEEESMAKRGKQDEHKPAATERKEQQLKAEPAAAPGLVADRESLAEKVKRRAEEERAKAAAAAEAAEEKTATAFSGWRERVAGQLEHLADMRWAEGVVETARRNKDVIATAVAAFSLGFFVSHKLFCRR